MACNGDSDPDDDDDQHFHRKYPNNPSDAPLLIQHRSSHLINMVCRMMVVQHIIRYTSHCFIYSVIFNILGI
jgi:hypothetical protein